MYLRTTTRRTKSGEVVRYLALAHNERNERGVPVANVVHNLGREDLLDRDALVRLVRSIQRFLGGEDGLRAAAPRGFDFVRAPESGGPHVVGELWAQLGIGRAIAGRGLRPRALGRGAGDLHDGLPALPGALLEARGDALGRPRRRDRRRRRGL